MSDEQDPFQLGSSRNPSTVVADGVNQFLIGSLYGGMWGLVTPFHAPGSVQAATELRTGMFRAARPFSSLASVGTNAVIFGGIMGVSRLSNKTLELARQREDYFNDAFGFLVTFGYYKVFLGSTEKRYMLHNRIIGSGVLCAVLYANFAV
mmetsp:Transcript_7523/g.13560  ORF Transcript_7523/g.13560 Transcript_7523/m.13560 type:complete len:150 (-) Transcript_7523:459-908(-)